MEFNVAQLMIDPVGSVRDYAIAESLEDVRDVDWASRGRGRVHLMRTNRGVLVRVRLEGMVNATCSRCLEPFQMPLQIAFEEEFLQTLDIETGLPVEVGEEDATAFTIDERHTLDLREATRQYGLLALPMQPVCRADCRGLCPVCGANLNLEPCQCAAAPVDQRWAALAVLAASSEHKKGAS